MTRRFFNMSVILLLSCATTTAQTADSVKLYQAFIQVCNAYKQVPLQLGITCTTTTNLALHQGDSTVVKAEFFVQPNAAYIHFGNAEQLITDSLMLFVTKENNQMMLSRGAVNIAAQLGSMLRLATNDTAAAQFFKRYRIIQTKVDDNNDALELTSRQQVYQTNLPSESVQLIYNRNTKNPVHVETVKRTLVRKPENYQTPASVAVITAPGNTAYLLKEDKAAYHFTKIEHDAAVALPVLLKDRVMKDAADNFIPVPAYKNFNLIQH